MKMMTCKQMSGPCDEPIYGETADEMLKNGEKHLTEMKNDGDEPHAEAYKMMRDMDMDSEEGKAWYAKFLADFNLLPEN